MNDRSAGEFRRPRPEERPAFEHLQRRAYASGAGTLARPATPDPEDTADADDGARAYFAGGQPVAGAYLKRYTTWWGDDELPMESVGGVAALPEVRRLGYTGRVMAGLTADMRERGIPISTITTPFSYAFYRRMGWEYAFRRIAASFSPAVAARLAGGEAAEARFVQCGVEADWLPVAIDAVYREVMRRRYQGGAARPPELWRARLRGERTYAYVVDGERGPTGYLICALDGGETVRIRELFALDGRAWRGLWHLIANLDSQAERIEWDMPPDVPLDLLVSEQHDLKLRWRPEGMLRIVDLHGAVQGRRAGSLSGRVCLRLEDDLAPWNGGPHEVEWTEGRAAVRAGSGSATAAQTAAMDHRTFAQIYAGAVTPVQAVAAGRADIGAAALPLLTAAYVTGRPPLLLEWH